MGRIEKVIEKQIKEIESTSWRTVKRKKTFNVIHYFNQITEMAKCLLANTSKTIANQVMTKKQRPPETDNFQLN